MDQPETHPVPDDSEAPPPPQIPWENRKQIGRIRAYLRTAKTVMISPGELEQFLDVPVCEKHAKKFRRVTFQLTFIITLSVLVTLLAKGFMIAYTPGRELQEVEAIMLLIFLRIAIGVLSLVGLFLATRSLEWFSCPRDFDPVRQDRAILLSCYVCAPVLIVTAVGAIASLIAILTRTLQGIETTLHVINLAWWAVFLAWWPAAVRAIHFTTGRRPQRTTIAAIALPLIWIAQQLMICLLPVSVFQWIVMSSPL